MRLLFVDLGNYCRSPVAAALVREEGRRRGAAIETDSAGIDEHHLGQPAHPMTVASAMKRGIDLSAHRCRRIGAADFAGFDLILAVDRDSLERLAPICPPEARHKLRLFAEIPDPNRQGAAAFERVLDLAARAAVGLVAELPR